MYFIVRTDDAVTQPYVDHIYEKIDGSDVVVVHPTDHNDLDQSYSAEDYRVENFEQPAMPQDFYDGYPGLVNIETFQEVRLCKTFSTLE